MDGQVAGATAANGGCSTFKKGPWTSAEDAILVAHVQKYGEGNWNNVQKNTGLSRCGKSCRLRWANHLRPNLKKGAFTPEEERTIIELHAKMGNKWARMAAQLPGRTDNEIKNYWNTRIKRRTRAGLPIYPAGLIHQQQHQHQHQQRHRSIAFSDSDVASCNLAVIHQNHRQQEAFGRAGNVFLREGTSGSSSTTSGSFKPGFFIDPPPPEEHDDHRKCLLEPKKEDGHEENSTRLLLEPDSTTESHGSNSGSTSTNFWMLQNQDLQDWDNDSIKFLSGVQDWMAHDQSAYDNDVLGLEMTMPYMGGMLVHHYQPDEQLLDHYSYYSRFPRPMEGILDGERYTQALFN